MICFHQGRPVSCTFAARRSLICRSSSSIADNRVSTDTPSADMGLSFLLVDHGAIFMHHAAPRHTVIIPVSSSRQLFAGDLPGMLERLTELGRFLAAGL